METATMGRVIVSASIENADDRYEVSKGRMSSTDVRSVEVDDALVDRGATTLALPTSMIQRLGLRPAYRRMIRTTNGNVDRQVYHPVWLKIQGQGCNVEVSEIPDGCPVLIGQIPLESMDWVIDPKGQRLIPNPDHGGEHMWENY